MIPFKHRLLESGLDKVPSRARKDLIPAYEQFCQSRATWLEDYALFRAVKAKVQDRLVPRVAIRTGPTGTLCSRSSARRALADEIDQVRLAQFLLIPARLSG